MKIKRLNTQDAGFEAELKALLAFETAQDDNIDQVVANILKDVKARGDVAVLEYTNRFDKTNAASLAALEIPHAELHAALNSLPAAQREACKLQLSAFVATTRNKLCNRGNILSRTAPCWDSKSLHWTALGCMCRAAKLRIRPLCS